MTYIVLNEYRRTVGSHDQKLVEKAEWELHEDELYEGTVFYRLNDGRDYFAKRALCRTNQERELRNLLALAGPHVPKVYEWRDDFGIVMDWIGGRPLTIESFAEAPNAWDVLYELDDFCAWASRRVKMSCIDVHCANIVVRLGTDKTIDEWWWVDWEHWDWAKGRVEQFLGRLRLCLTQRTSGVNGRESTRR
jgi:hypothetical protein